MTFSDDDLKRLKDCSFPASNDLWVGLFNKASQSFEKFDLNALLVRLEAADKVIDYLCHKRLPKKLAELVTDALAAAGK